MSWNSILVTASDRRTNLHVDYLKLPFFMSTEVCSGEEPFRQLARHSLASGEFLTPHQNQSILPGGGGASALRLARFLGRGRTKCLNILVRSAPPQRTPAYGLVQAARFTRKFVPSSRLCSAPYLAYDGINNSRKGREGNQHDRFSCEGRGVRAALRRVDRPLWKRQVDTLRRPAGRGGLTPETPHRYPQACRHHRGEARSLFFPRRPLVDPGLPRLGRIHL